MKIVIISRSIYPVIAPRPMRATELAKYFSKIGHDVTLYGVLGDFDYTRFTQDTGVEVKNIGKMRFATLNSDGKCRENVIDKILRRLLHRFLEFPDIELSWKMKGVLRKEKNVDLLITIAIPFPIHWGVAWAKSKLKDGFPKKWISDCGDPYMGNSVHKPLPYFKYVESYWGRKTDYITVPIEEAKNAYSPALSDKIHVIPQGFDYSNINIDRDFKRNSIPHFAYAGVVYRGYRDPDNFLKYLCTLDYDFRFIVYTKNDSVFGLYKDQLGEKLIIRSYIPRDSLLFELSRMDFLINLVNSNSVQSPSKLIDYYLTERPILDISTAFNEKSDFDNFINSNYESKRKIDDIEQYNIANVGNKFLNLY